MANRVLLVLFFIFLYISLIGSLNWGLIAMSNFNLVQFISNKNKNVEKTLYSIVGFSAIITFILSLVFLSCSTENFLQSDYREYYEEESHDNNDDNDQIIAVSF